MKDCYLIVLKENETETYIGYESTLLMELLHNPNNEKGYVVRFTNDVIIASWDMGMDIEMKQAHEHWNEFKKELENYKEEN